MSRLTWKDTAQPNFGSSAGDIARASMLLQSSLGGLSDTLGSVADRQRTEQESALKAQQEAALSRALGGVLERSGDAEATQDYLRGLGSNAQGLGPKGLIELLGTNGTAITQNQGRVNLDHSVYTNDRQRGFDTAEDAYAPIHAEVLLRQSMGDLAGGEKVQAENFDPLARLSLETQAKVIKNSSGERDGRQGFVNAVDNNSRAWNQEGRAATNHRDSQTDRAEGRAAQELVAWANQRGATDEQRSALIAQSGQPARVIQMALNGLSSTRMLGEADPMASVSGRGGSQGGNQAQQGQGAAPGGKAATLAADGLNIRDSQSQNIWGLQDYDTLQADTRDAATVAKELVGKEGTFAGASEADFIDKLNEVRRATGNTLSYAAAGAILKQNVHGNSGLNRVLSSPLFSPLTAFTSDRKLTSGGTFFPGSVALSEEGVNADIARYMNPGAEGVREQAAERGELRALQERAQGQKEQAFKALEDARKHARVTGNYSQIPQFELAYQAASEGVAEVADGIRNSNVGSPLYNDPNSPVPQSLSVLEGNQRTVDAQQVAAAATQREAELNQVTTELQGLQRQLDRAQAALKTPQVEQNPVGKKALTQHVKDLKNRIEPLERQMNRLLPE